VLQYADYGGAQGLLSLVLCALQEGKIFCPQGNLPDNWAQALPCSFSQPGAGFFAASGW
jgi:hypothetical protein